MMDLPFDAAFGDCCSILRTANTCSRPKPITAATMRTRLVTVLLLLGQRLPPMLRAGLDRGPPPLVRSRNKVTVVLEDSRSFFCT